MEDLLTYLSTYSYLLSLFVAAVAWYTVLLFLEFLLKKIFPTEWEEICGEKIPRRWDFFYCISLNGAEDELKIPHLVSDISKTFRDCQGWHFNFHIARMTTSKETPWKDGHYKVKLLDHLIYGFIVDLLWIYVIYD